MKSERRHELQSNYLANHLGTAVESGKPYGVYIAVGLGALVVIAIGYGLYAAQAARANALAWGDYYFNIGTGDAEVFQQLAKDHPNTPAANWAMQAWADNQLMQGLEGIYNNREKATATIDGAIEAYEKILQSSYEQELKNRAAIGLAQAYEATGRLDEATRHYQQVAGGEQDGFATMAQQRLAWIKSGEGKAFYDWFASVRNTPTAPPQIPGNLSQPPTTPDMTFPKKQNPLTLPEASTTPPVTNEPGAPAGNAPTGDLPTGNSPSTPSPTSLQLDPALPSSDKPAAEPTGSDKPVGEDQATTKESEAENKSTGEESPTPLSLPPS